jgi:Uri superfamily endonuclease
MSEKNSGYNPEGLSDEELKEIDNEAARNRNEKLKGLSDKNVKLKLKKNFNTGLKTHRNVDFLRDKDDVEDNEAANKSLNKEIKKLLEQYKFIGSFKLSASRENKGNYIFRLLVKPIRSVKYKTKLEFEDKAEKIMSRLLEYMDNMYDKF